MNRALKILGIVVLAVLILGVVGLVAVPAIFANIAPDMIEDAQGDTSDEAEQIHLCSNALLDIASGDSSQAIVQQISGDQPVGEVLITWTYQDGSTAEATIDIEELRMPLEATSGASGTLIGITAEPVDCRGAPSASYSP